MLYRRVDSLLSRHPVGGVALSSLDVGARSARKPKGSGHLRRTEILEAAQRIFVQCGYEGATIRKIADDVGVSSTALYMHFRDKGEILVEICEGLYARLIEINGELIEREMDPVLRVRAMLDAYVDFALDHPNVYRLLYCGVPDVARLDRDGKLGRMGARTFSLFLQAVSAAAKASRLQAGDAEAVAKSSWAAAHGVVSLVLMRPQYPWGEPRDACAFALDAVFRGLFRD